MQFFDISQEVFTCAVYPGDPAPAKEVLASLEAGDVCNLTAFSMDRRPEQLRWAR